MPRGATITAIRAADLTSAAAQSALLAALSGDRAISFVDGDRSAALIEQITDAPRDCALVVLTSGSTGTPKAVALSAPGLIASAVSSLARLAAPPRASWSLLLPLHHVAGVQVLLRALINQGSLGTIDDEVDFTSIVPTQLQRALNGDDRLKVHLQRARAVLVGGAALATPLRAAAQDAGIHVVPTYGMTETGGGCIYDGRPLDGVHVTIDNESRLRIEGPMVALGYLNDAEASAAVFTDGGYRTSDLGTIEDGMVRVIGRADAVINSGGEKISLPRVEEALRAHPMVIDAIAAGAPDSTWGDRLVVGVVPSGAVSLAEIRDFISERIDRVHAPRALMVLREIPTTSLGKPDRPALLTHPIAEEI